MSADLTALWVLAHPSAASFNAQLADAAVAGLRKDGWTVEFADLYRLGWNPLLTEEGGDDVRTQQQHLRDADLVILQFPLWWYGPPAILKGWIDRVFEAGFAYDVCDPVTGRAQKYGPHAGLAGKRALAIVTAGDRRGSIAERGISGHIDDILWPLLHGTFWYTGMYALHPHLVTEVRNFDSANVADEINTLKDRLLTVMTEPPIPYLPMDDDHYDHSIQLHPHISAGRSGTTAHRATGGASD